MYYICRIKATGERLFYTAQLGFQTAEMVNQRSLLIYTSANLLRVLDKAARMDALVFKEGCTRPV
jgi:hypothetical protein